jgi:hypothetical protein
MFTIKVTKRIRNVDLNGVEVAPMIGRFSTRIVEAEQVDVHILRPGELTEVAWSRGDINGAFYVIPHDAERPQEFADEVEFWFEAFIENSTGATTEMVRF